MVKTIGETNIRIHHSLHYLNSNEMCDEIGVIRKYVSVTLVVYSVYSDLYSVYRWSYQNMNFNLEKCHICFNNAPKMQVLLGNSILNMKKSVEDLGRIVQIDLSWSSMLKLKLNVRNFFLSN